MDPSYSLLPGLPLLVQMDLLYLLLPVVPIGLLLPVHYLRYKWSVLPYDFVGSNLDNPPSRMGCRNWQPPSQLQADRGSVHRLLLLLLDEEQVPVVTICNQGSFSPLGYFGSGGSGEGKQIKVICHHRGFLLQVLSLVTLCNQKDLVSKSPEGIQGLQVIR